MLIKIPGEKKKKDILIKLNLLIGIFNLDLGAELSEWRNKSTTGFGDVKVKMIVGQRLD